MDPDTRPSSSAFGSRDARVAPSSRFFRSRAMYFGSSTLLTITPVTSFMLPASWHVLGPQVPTQMGIRLALEFRPESQPLGGTQRNFASDVRLNCSPWKSTLLP